MQDYKEILERLEKQSLLRSLRQIDFGPENTVEQHGKTLLLFSSNNYLGLANHPKIKVAAIEAIRTWGFGGGASRLVSGNIKLYQELEEKLAHFKKTRSALVFSSGYMANLGTICAIAKKGDLILADRLSHASLVDGCRLSGATFRVYRHRDMEHLQKCLANRKKSQNTLIVTDGVFSMDGDITPLPEILALAEDYDATVYLDDAHATGVLGEHGGGTAEYFQCSSPQLIQMGTLSKALGGLGGFIAGPDDLIQFLINKARPFIYSTALQPSTLAGAIAALDLIGKDQSLLKTLWRNRNYFSKKITALGFNILKSETPIFPVMIGDSEKALTFSKYLLENGIHVSAIRPPTVPKDSARLRITITATHTQDQIDHLLNGLEEIGRELRVI